MFLKAGVRLDFETLSSLKVSVTAGDPSLGTPASQVSTDYVLSIANVSPERIVGTTEVNVLTGGSDIDVIYGLAGNNTMRGLAQGPRV